MASIMIVMMINSTSLAQERKEKEISGIAELQTRRMEVTLNLRGEQLSHVSQINTQFMNELQDALADRENEELLTEAKVMKIIKDRNDSLSKVLTHDQMSEMILAESNRMASAHRRRMF